MRRIRRETRISDVFGNLRVHEIVFIGKNQMNDPFSSFPDRGPIPEEFHQECGDGPFIDCQICSEPLADQSSYSLIREVQGSRCIFELALCTPCAMELADQLSEVSAERVEEWRSRRARIDFTRVTCSHCGTPKDELTRFSSQLLCRGGSFLSDPEILCVSCENEVQELLSSETREEYENWFRENVPGLPSADIEWETLISKL